MKSNRILREIPADVLAKYKAYEITSEDVATLLNVNAASVRRAIERNNKPPTITQRKKELAAIRRAFRATLAHLPVKEIMEKAYVSKSTAIRIKERYAGK